MNTLRKIAKALCVTLLCMGIVNNTMAAVVTYYHNDISGSPIAATDAAGNLKWKESYKPYGDKLTRSSVSTDNDIGFHGKVHDDSTGLSYMGARYYDPVLGRFMGVDPVDFQIDNLHSFNRYAYTNNNPNKYIDPDGEFAILAIPILEYILPIAASLAAGYVAKNIADTLSHGALTTPSFQGIVLNPTHVHDTPLPSPGNMHNESDTSNSPPRDTLKPGSFAGESIPARGPGRDWSKSERDQINGIGKKSGCHTCGNTDPGTKSGNFVPDHQTPSALNAAGNPQRLYPHCLTCSRVQGGQVRGATRK
ncbi:RHS repeat-associated core domain-containing protein [Pseudomonas sp. Marseille-Q5299]|uniref:RHS repeat domain-containing protein n=1 Tax=Pseudomonas sp. Marseille-Q5299 TaxID=2942201 RepID=UPI002073D4E1|nr:RHS repeat-associated core domain-containing protein [Pseudomonas sp. Marseille-Q5299]